METFSDITEVMTALASLAAVVVAVLAFWTYRDIRPASQRKRRQDEHMNHLASQLIQVLDRQQTFVDAQVHNFDVDPYNFRAAGLEANQLIELLDGCSQLDLTRYCVGGQDRQHRWALYGAFRADLAERAELEPGEADPSSYTKQHGLMGVIRVACLCLEYEGLPLARDLAAQLKDVGPQLREEAWTYIGGQGD